MTDKPNFVLVPDPDPNADDGPSQTAVALPGRLRALAASITSLLPFGRPAAMAESDPAALAAVAAAAPRRPRLVFGFDATASREPAWATARRVTDALVRALPGELDVALAVHGGSRLHTFTEFTADPNRLRDRAAVTCIAGRTQLLPILSRSLSSPGVRVVTYIGDVYEESPARGRKLADELGRRGIRLIVLHDTAADWNARRDAELFLDLARRTGGCVLPFDANAPERLRELLAAIAVFAVGGTELLQEKRGELPGAVALLQLLRPK
jgi:hypothetical protein